MSGLVTPESLSREGSPIPEYSDSGATSPLHSINTAATYDVNSAPSPPPPTGMLTDLKFIVLTKFLSFILSSYCYVG